MQPPKNWTTHVVNPPSQVLSPRQSPAVIDQMKDLHLHNSRKMED